MAKSLQTIDPRLAAQLRAKSQDSSPTPQVSHLVMATPLLQRALEPVKHQVLVSALAALEEAHLLQRCFSHCELPRVAQSSLSIHLSAKREPSELIEIVTIPCPPTLNSLH